jgi:2-methylisocitrate lyase-like PEP mutase family enzyme
LKQLYFSDAAMTASMGLPGLGIITIDEVAYASIRGDGGTKAMLGDMPTRDELYDLIALAEFEALDASIVQSIVCRRALHSCADSRQNGRRRIAAFSVQLRSLRRTLT